MDKRIYLFLSITLLLMLPVGGTGAQDDGLTCETIVRQAVDLTGELCQTVGRNQVCYGHALIDASMQANRPGASFTMPGDIVNIADVRSLIFSPLDLAAGSWGISLITLQADLPETLPDQYVTLVAFGDVQLRGTAPVGDPIMAHLTTTGQDYWNVRLRPSPGAFVLRSLAPGEAVRLTGRLDDASWVRVVLPESGHTGWLAAAAFAAGAPLVALPIVAPDADYYRPMQAFFVQTTERDGPCPEAPPSGLLIQTPEGSGRVRFLVNEIGIQLGSTVFVQAIAGDALVIALLDGQVQIIADGVVQTLFPGSMIRVPLNVDLTPAGPPGIPEPFDTGWLHDLPLGLLPHPVELPESLTDADIQALLADLMLAQATLTPSPVPPTATPLPPVEPQSVPVSPPDDPVLPPEPGLVATGRCGANGEYVYDIRNVGTVPLGTTWHVVQGGVDAASGPVDLAPGGAMQVRDLYLIGEAALHLDAYGIPLQSNPEITCVAPDCPTYDVFPVTAPWTVGEVDTITLLDQGPVAYSVEGVITTDGNRIFLSESGILNNGDTLTIAYPAPLNWGPPDSTGLRSAHVTVFMRVTDGRPCDTVSHDWGRFF